VSKENQKLTVGGGSSALLGGSGGLLTTSGALLHVHVHTTSGLSFGDENLSSLLVDASAVLDGIKGLVEVTSNAEVVDLEKVISDTGGGEVKMETHFASVGSDDSSDKALQVLVVLPVSGHGD
jgi:hypothetical protein